ncbi:MAG TPA: hypothetical protein VGN14_05705 [Candidatus Elarobacter sp.]
MNTEKPPVSFVALLLLAIATLIFVALAGVIVRHSDGTTAAGAALRHVQTWYYYGLNDVNASVAPATMARYADFVEDDGFTAQHAEAFKRAGGRYAVAYTDPAYVPACIPPFSPPAGRCKGPIGNLVQRDESAWFHAADGARVHRFDSYNNEYQEALDPSSASARSAYARATAEIVAHAPGLDFFFADDSGSPWREPGDPPGAVWFEGFNAPGVEIPSDQNFIAAEIAMLSAAARPVFINGSDPRTLLPSYGGAYLRAPRIAGEVNEDCYRAGRAIVGDRWRRQGDALLAVTALHRYAACFMQGTTTPANRVYALASWWLTYDARWSVAAPIDPVSGGTAILPEFGIVPGAPLRTASRSIDLLREGAIYAREFGACTQDGSPIGPCAAIVNAGNGDAPVPPLHRRYASVLVLDGRDAISGGTASWRRGPPSEVSAGNALILRG